jgi:hypothetical protein
MIIPISSVGRRTPAKLLFRRRVLTVDDFELGHDSVSDYAYKAKGLSLEDLQVDSGMVFADLLTIDLCLARRGRLCDSCST